MKAVVGRPFSGVLQLVRIDSGSAIRKRYLFEEKNIQFLSLKAKCTAATRVTVPLAERPC